MATRRTKGKRPRSVGQTRFRSFTDKAEAEREINAMHEQGWVTQAIFTKTAPTGETVYEFIMFLPSPGEWVYLPMARPSSP
jgi:hypothetical protein